MKTTDDLFDQSENSLKIFQEFILISQENKGIWDIFELFFETVNSSNISLKRQISQDIAINTIVALQAISTFWYPNATETSWNFYMEFWEFWGYTNPDRICEYFDILNECFFACIFFHSYIFLVLILIGVFHHFGKSLNYIFIRITRTFLVIFTSILFIPCMSIYCHTIIYSLKLRNKLDNENSTDILNFGAIGAIVSFIFIIILAILSISLELYSADISHSKTKNNANSRSHSQLQISAILLYIYLSFLHSLMVENYIAPIYILELSLCINFLITFWIRLPFYNSIRNYIELSKFGSIAIMILAFLLSFSLNMPFISIFCFIIFIPFALATFYRALFSKIEKLKLKNGFFKNEYDFELRIRSSLINPLPNREEDILDYFSGFQCQNPLFVIWEYHYCANVLNDERLARIKLTKIRKTMFIIEGSLQKWKIMKQLRKSELPDVKYIQYLSAIENVKKHDKSLCINLNSLLKETVSKNPEINKIMKSLLKFSSSLMKTKNLYASLIENFQRLDGFDLFYSLSNKILKDDETSNYVRAKRNRINELQLISKSEDWNHAFNDNLGIMLVSANVETIGTIVHINEKASEIMKISCEDVLGLEINEFIPKFYAYHHREYMKAHSTSCKNTNLKIENKIFLLDSSEHIIECDMDIKLSALNHHAFYLLTFKPFNFPREVMLLSNDGKILGYSSQIPVCFDVSATNELIESNIQQLIPDYYSLPISKFHHIKYKNKVIGVIRHEHFNASTIFHILFVADTEERIAYLKNLEYSKDFFDSQVSNSSYESLSIPLISQNEKIATKTLTGEYFDTQNDHEVFTGVRERNFLSQESIYLNTNSPAILNNKVSVRMHKLTTRSLNDIKSFKCVLTGAVIIMVGINLSIFSVVYDIVSHSNSLQTFPHLGEILYYVSSLGNTVRIVDTELTSNVYNFTRDFAMLIDHIDSLKNLKNLILSDYDDWSYCSASKIVNQQQVPIWFFEPNPHLLLYNLYDAIELFITHGSKFIYEVNSNRTRYDDYQFLMINSLGFPSKEINIAMKKLVKCESERVKDSGKTVTILMVCIALILAIIILYFIFCINMIQKTNDDFWEYLRKNAVKSYFSVRHELGRRLSLLHKWGNLKENKANSTENKKIKSKGFIRYSFRLLLFIAIALSLYFFIIFYLFANCESASENRPWLIYNFIERRALVPKIGMFARDINNPKIFTNYKTSYGLANSTVEMDYLINEFIKASKELLQDKYLQMISKELWDRYFDQIKSIDPILELGLKSELGVFILDSYHIATPDGRRSFSEVDYYLRVLSTIQNEISEEYELADRDSKEWINSQLEIFIYVISSFSVAIWLINWCYFWPFFTKEAKFINTMQLFSAIIANNQ